MTDSAGPDPRDLTARASPPAHEAEGFANQHWAKQLVAIERLMDKSKLACWKAAAETPQTGRIIDLQVHWEDDGGSRLQLSSYLDPAHNENLNRLFDLYSAHAHPLLGLCQCHQPPNHECGAGGHSVPRHCKAQRVSPTSWLLPMRCRWGTAVREWPDVLLEHLPGAGPTLQLAPAAMMEEACAADVDEATCSRLYRRIPLVLRDTLEAYQRDSVRFALRRGGRVLLADEMGLGKSLQALAIAAAYRGNKSGNERFWPLLIVCPTSMRDVWVSLVERWLPFVPAEELCVLRHSMDMVTRREVTICSYTLLHEYLRAPIKRRHSAAPFKCVILDESHHAAYYTAAQRQPKTWRAAAAAKAAAAKAGRPNPAAPNARPVARAQGATAIPENTYDTLSALCSLGEAEQKLIFLSGTPMKRSVASLYGQLHLLRPAAFAEYDAFGTRYCKYKDETRGCWDGELAERRSELHGYLLNRVMVRRLKTEVMGDALKPILREVVHTSAGGSKERAHLRQLHARYEGALQAERPSVQAIRMARARFWQATGLAKAGMSAAELEKLFPVKKGKTAPGASDGDDAAEVDLSEECEDGDEERLPSAPTWLKDAILSMARPPDNGKMIVFAHHRQVMDAANALLDGMRSEARSAFGSADFFRRVDGSNVSDRTELLRQFEEDASVRVALLSLTAFSTGITLNAASTIVFLELYGDWNELAQAESRCHRRGQHRQVSVYYLLAKHSFDEVLWPRLLRQKETTASLIDQEEAQGEAAAVEPAAAEAEAVELADEEEAPRRKRRRVPTFSRVYADSDAAVDGAAVGEGDAAGGVGEAEGGDGEAGLAGDAAVEESDAKNLDAIFAEQPDTHSLEDAAEEAAKRRRAEDAAEEEARLVGRVAFWPSPWSARAFLYSTDSVRGYLGASFDASRPLAADGSDADARLSSHHELRKHRRQIEAFLLEYSALSNSQRTSLGEWAGRQFRPVQLPLCNELESAAAAALQHTSTRRYARRDEFGPSNETSADARTIEWRAGKTKEPKVWNVRRHPSPSRAESTWLCLYCAGERDESGARCEPDSPFCSTGCVDAYLLRIGHGSHGRKACFDRDKGICAACKRDCHGLFLRLKPLPADRRREVLLEEFAGPDGPGSLLTTRRLEGIVKRCQEGDIWEADHIKPVAGGGGEATSSAQLQTLCVPCHNAKTRRDGRPKKQARSTDVPRRKSGAGAVSSHVEPLVDAEMDAAAPAGSDGDGADGGARAVMHASGLVFVLSDSDDD